MQLLSYFVVRRETAPIISYSNPQRSNSRVKGEKFNRRLTIAENSGAWHEIFKLYVKLAIVELALSKSCFRWNCWPADYLVDIFRDKCIYHLSRKKTPARREFPSTEMDSESVSTVKSTSFSGRSLLSKRTMSSAASSADPRFRKTPVAPQVNKFTSFFFNRPFSKNVHLALRASFGMTWAFFLTTTFSQTFSAFILRGFLWRNCEGFYLFCASAWIFTCIHYIPVACCRIRDDQFRHAFSACEFQLLDFLRVSVHSPALRRWNRKRDELVKSVCFILGQDKEKLETIPDSVVAQKRLAQCTTSYDLTDRSGNCLDISEKPNTARAKDFLKGRQ